MRSNNYLQTMESNLYELDLAIESATSRQEQDKLFRKKKTIQKKIRKLRRKMDNEDYSSVRSEQDYRQ